MPSDREIAERASRLAEHGRDYSFVEIPSYREWARAKLREGESAAFIAHLDAMAMFLLPHELGEVGVEEFEELLADLEQSAGEGPAQG